MKKNRVFSVVILLFLLVGFPLASWLYLQKGVDYRVDVLTLLTPKVQLPDSYDHHADIRVLYSENDLQIRLSPIREHYASRRDLVFDAYMEGDLSSDLKDSLLLAMELCNKQFGLDEAAFLCDTAGNILYAYGIPEDEELARLAEHVAFVLPLEEKKDILIKKRAGEMSEMRGHPNVKRLNRLAWVVSAIVFLLILMMRRYKVETDIDFSWLPPVYSLLNTLTFVVLLAGLYFIRVKQNQKVHRSLMITAMVFSAVFLMLYVVYHFTTGETTFCRQGGIRYVYFFLLISHIILAAVILPFILFTFIRAFTGQFKGHKKMARWVFPLWAYVTISGPVCYLLLLPCYG